MEKSTHFFMPCPNASVVAWAWSGSESTHGAGHMAGHRVEHGQRIVVGMGIGIRLCIGLGIRLDMGLVMRLGICQAWGWAWGLLSSKLT